MLMRWFVEISPLGANEGPKHKWCIEAAGWQPALKDARALRGEEGPLGGFSIELLDDGARAVDPVARIRYVIRDEGPGFDPATLPDPTDPANLDRPCGRGLLLMRTFMDDVGYNRSGNEVTLIKYASLRPAMTAAT